MSSLQEPSSISKLLASSNHQKSDVYAYYDHSFRNLWDSSGEFSLKQSGPMVQHRVRCVAKIILPSGRLLTRRRKRFGLGHKFNVEVEEFDA